LKILQLTAHFKPNIGGVETHLDDLCKILIKKNFEVVVLTYRPLETETAWRIFEKNKNIEIIRIPWIPKLFYRLVSKPIFEFIYLIPGLFFVMPFILLIKNPEVIHSHGLVAGVVGVFWGKIFRKRIVISTHSIYSFPEEGLYRKFATLILKNANCVLTLSKQAVNEIVSLGISKSKVKNFTYWIDLEKFKRIDNAKVKLSWEDKFISKRKNLLIVLFVGRLVLEKGVEQLLNSVKMWNKNIKLKIIGSGPLETKVRETALKLSNLEYIEGIDSKGLPLYYSGSDLLIVPSVSEEGFGRVILEALACGTPVIGSNRGAISEAMDDTVGKIISVYPENIKNAVYYYYKSRNELNKLAKNCRNFAERRYSEDNAEKIIEAYGEQT